MPLFTARHYKVIASLLGAAIREAEDSCLIDSLPETSLYTFRDILSEAFVEDNPHFDPINFHHACMREDGNMYEEREEVPSLESVIDRVHEVGFLVHTLMEYPAGTWLAIIVAGDVWKTGKADNPTSALVSALEQEKHIVLPWDKGGIKESVDDLFAAISRKDND